MTTIKAGPDPESMKRAGREALEHGRRIVVMRNHKGDIGIATSADLVAGGDVRVLMMNRTEALDLAGDLVAMAELEPEGGSQ